jgi:type I restriction enzyme, S subunit
MGLKPGCKQTEAGVIPEDWEICPLASVAQIIDPQPDHRTPPEAKGGEPYIGISDFLDDHSVNWDASRKIISRAVDKQRASFQIHPGDIIFGKIGTIGSPKFAPPTPFRYALSANVLLIQPTIEPYFVMSWLRSGTCQRAIGGELHTTSQAAFGINKMRRVKIPLAPKPEQRAIAAALSDADTLIP